MEQPSDKIVRYLVIFVVAVALIKVTSESGIFASSTHKGKGYLVIIPEGWKKVKQKKGAVLDKTVEILMIAPETIDTDNRRPDVFISIYSVKLSTPMWIEDEFPNILKELIDEGFKIMDKGEIKIDDVISKWVVYHDKKIPALNLELYLVTDSSMFYKMWYSAGPEQFNVFRSDFEKFKDSFKFRFSMY